jgi:hypothetical protein
MMDFVFWQGAASRETGAYMVVREDFEAGRNVAREQKTHF